MKPFVPDAIFLKKFLYNFTSSIKINLFNPPSLTRVNFGNSNFLLKLSIYYYKGVPDFPNRQVTRG